MRGTLDDGRPSSRFSFRLDLRPGCQLSKRQRTNEGGKLAILLAASEQHDVRGSSGGLLHPTSIGVLHASDRGSWVYRHSSHGSHSQPARTDADY